jgi:hypothetical protein
VHEGGIRIEVFDDGALRFVKANGKAIDSVAPGCTQPLGDWRQLPRATAMYHYRGDRMDYSLGVDVLLQRARKERNAPAGM